MRGLALVLLLAFSAGAHPQEKLKTCLDCHGASGASNRPLTPSLGGQPSFYVIAQLFLFRAGRREALIMNEQAKALTDDELRALSDAIAKLPAPSRPERGRDAAQFQRGKAIVEQRHCTGCHGQGFDGHKNVPRVAHQREDYLAKALKDYASGRRIGYGTAIMPETVSGLSEAQLDDVAHYLAHL